MLVSFEEKVLAAIAVLLMVFAVVIGFSQRTVTIAGTEYSCGSGFVHSEQTWKTDSKGLGPKRTPATACPSQIYKDRNIAIALGLLAILTAVVVFGMGDSSTVSGRTRYIPRRTPTALH